jgi:hypothetical protein
MNVGEFGQTIRVNFNSDISSADFDGNYVKFGVNSEEWGAIVKYVADHADDIENEINDYKTLKPILKFFNRNVKNT